MYFLLL